MALAFLRVSEVWSFQTSFLSNVSPKYFTFFCQGMSVLFSLSVWVSLLSRRVKRMACVFCPLMAIFQSVAQALMGLRWF